MIEFNPFNCNSISAKIVCIPCPSTHREHLPDPTQILRQDCKTTGSWVPQKRKFDRLENQNHLLGCNSCRGIFSGSQQGHVVAVTCGGRSLGNDFATRGWFNQWRIGGGRAEMPTMEPSTTNISHQTTTVLAKMLEVCIISGFVEGWLYQLG